MIARLRPSTWAPTSSVSGELSIRAGPFLFGAVGVEPTIARTPSVHVNRYTMPRKKFQIPTFNFRLLTSNLQLLSQEFLALCANQNSLSRGKFKPLQIWPLSFLCRRIIFSSQLYPSPNNLGLFSTNLALPNHSFMLA